MEAVHDSLGRLDGVHSVAIDLQENLVTVTPASDRMLDLIAVADAIKGAGFRSGRMTVRAKTSVKAGPQGSLLCFLGWSEWYPWSGGLVEPDEIVIASVDYSTRPPKLAPLR